MATDSDPTIHGRTGVPVDIHGGPTVDPTKNVLDLVDAAVRRQDDVLREIVKRVDEQSESVKYLLSLEQRHFRELLTAHDRRYEQRYEASQKALEAALIAQKEAVREAFAAQKEAINAALTSADRAVSKAESAAEKRFEGVNEFRGQLADQQRTLLPRQEAENRLATMSEKIAILESFRTEVLSRGTGAKEGYGFAVGVVGVVLTVVSLIALGVRAFSL